MPFALTGERRHPGDCGDSVGCTLFDEQGDWLWYRLTATLTGLERAIVGDDADKVGEYLSGIGDDLCDSGEAFNRVVPP